jgi:hypothetical protein
MNTKKVYAFNVEIIINIAENSGKNAHDFFGEILDNFPDTDFGIYGHKIREKDWEVTILLGVFPLLCTVTPENLLKIFDNFDKKIRKANIVFKIISLTDESIILKPNE